MNYAARIIGYPLVLLVIMLSISHSFDGHAKTTLLLFFLFVVTVEPLAAIFDWPFRYFRRKRTQARA